MSACVEVKNVTKNFSDAIALNRVTLSFEKGQIHGIIGRNGSGKTVLLKCICGFLSPSSGEILVSGQPVRTSAPQDNIGIIIESPGFVMTQSAMRNLTQLAALRNRIDKDRVRSAIQAVGLDPDSKKRVGKYSLGMRQRLGLAQAIMEDPDILILDEPMNGLDNQGVRDISKTLLEFKAKGKTILLASHSRDDLRALCDTICELDHGSVIATGGVELLEDIDNSCYISHIG